MNKEERVMWDTLKYDYDRNAKLRGNPELLQHIAISKKMGRVTEPLANAIVYMAEREWMRKKGWHGLTYMDDMVSFAVMQSIQNILKFDEKKSSNPFAYITTMINGSFCNYMNKERRQDIMKQELALERKRIAEQLENESVLRLMGWISD